MVCMITWGLLKSEAWFAVAVCSQVLTSGRGELQCVFVLE